MLSRPVNLRLSSWETGPCLSMLDSLAAVGFFYAQALLLLLVCPGLPWAIQAGRSIARFWL